jgi:nitrile hydratase subunit beta
MFAPGETVRVKDEWPEARGPVHIRTPHYIRGITGQVVRHLGDFPNPEDLAFRRPAAPRPLYHVRFPIGAIWPEAKPHDELLIEIYGHWLEKP